MEQLLLLSKIIITIALLALVTTLMKMCDALILKLLELMYYFPTSVCVLYGVYIISLYIGPFCILFSVIQYIYLYSQHGITI